MLRRTSSSKLLRLKTVASLPGCGSANCQPRGKETDFVRRCHAHAASVAVRLEWPNRSIRPNEETPGS
jgi:hypothetical protein